MTASRQEQTGSTDSALSCVLRDTQWSPSSDTVSFLFLLASNTLISEALVCRS